MQLAFEEILGQQSAHSFATGPVMADPVNIDSLKKINFITKYNKFKFLDYINISIGLSLKAISLKLF